MTCFPWTLAAHPRCSKHPVNLTKQSNLNVAGHQICIHYPSCQGSSMEQDRHMDSQEDTCAVFVMWYRVNNIIGDLPLFADNSLAYIGIIPWFATMATLFWLELRGPLRGVHFVIQIGLCTLQMLCCSKTGPRRMLSKLHSLNQGHSTQNNVSPL